MDTHRLKSKKKIGLSLKFRQVMFYPEVTKNVWLMKTFDQETRYNF